MRKIFFIALIMFNISTLLEAHPFPTDEKLYEYGKIINNYRNDFIKKISPKLLFSPKSYILYVWA